MSDVESHVSLVRVHEEIYQQAFWLNSSGFMAGQPDKTSKAIRSTGNWFSLLPCKRRRRLVPDEELEQWLRCIDSSGAFLARYGQVIAKHFDTVDQFKEYKKPYHSRIQSIVEAVHPSLFEVLDIRLADRPVLARGVLGLQ